MRTWCTTQCMRCACYSKWLALLLGGGVGRLQAGSLWKGCGQVAGVSEILSSRGRVHTRQRMVKRMVEMMPVEIALAHTCAVSCQANSTAAQYMPIHCAASGCAILTFHAMNPRCIGCFGARPSTLPERRAHALLPTASSPCTRTPSPCPVQSRPSARPVTHSGQPQAPDLARPADSGTSMYN